VIIYNSCIRNFALRSVAFPFSDIRTSALRAKARRCAAIIRIEAFGLAAVLFLVAGCEQDAFYVRCQGPVEVRTNDLAPDVTTLEARFVVRRSENNIFTVKEDGSFRPVCSGCQQKVTSHEIRWSFEEPASEDKPWEQYSYRIDLNSGRLDGSRSFHVSNPIAMVTTTKQTMRCESSSSPFSTGSR
jgi:hypothetical protein